MIRRPLVHGPAADGTGELAALETVCATCAGVGFIEASRDGSLFTGPGQCNDCYGAGTIVTDDGKRLLAFLRRHSR